MAKIEYKSDEQVKEHLAKYKPETHKSMAHEKMEAPKFEKAEHRLNGKRMKGGSKALGKGKKL